MYRHSIVALLLVSAAMWSPVQAQESIGVLNDKDADQADAGALQAEASLFESIRQGMELSIAQCELTPKCTPTVSREELHRIVGKLETRLDAVTARHSAQGDAALEPVMLAYVETRDRYNEFLTKVDRILPPESESGGRNFDAVDLPPEFAIFADAEAELSDDTEEPLPDDTGETPSTTEQQ